MEVLKRNPPTEAANSAAVREETGGLWYQLPLAWAGFYYPFFLVSSFLVNAFPALIRATILHHRLKFLFLSPFIVGAVSGRSRAPGQVNFQTSLGNHPSPIEAGLELLGVLWLSVVLARKHRGLAGMGLAVFCQVASLPWLTRLFFRKQTTAEVLLAAAAFFAASVLGSRWMLARFDSTGYLRRVVALGAGVICPPAALLGLAVLVEDFRVPVELFMLSALAAAVASAWPFRETSSGPPRAVWKLAGVGFGLSVFLAVAMSLGGRSLSDAFRKNRLAQNRAAVAALPPIPAGLPFPKVFFQRGITLTAEFPDVYASEEARRMLEEFPRFGVNAVSLVPYGFSSLRFPLVRFSGGDGSLESDEGVEELSRVAHARGLRVLLKPGIWAPGGYAGDLKFASPDDRAKWFDQYGLFLEHYARLSARVHADLFSVGGEFPGLSQYAAEWRKLIARARALYPGPLTYAANFGPEFESITFWDALDYIGVQEYYPLPDDLSTDSIVAKVEAVQRKFQRPVIFTEAGFSSHPAPNRKPWDDSPGRPSPDGQARCYDAVFRAFYDRPWFQGVYWWKVGTNGYGGAHDTSHTPWGKPAMEVIARWYLRGGR